MQKQLSTGAARVMRGSGSSAASVFIWRCFSEMRARSSSPMHLAFRATGSGAGQTEIVGRDAATPYDAAVDFGLSDTPMPDELFADLTLNAKIVIVHVPVLLVVGAVRT